MFTKVMYFFSKANPSFNSKNLLAIEYALLNFANQNGVTKFEMSIGIITCNVIT